MALAARPTAASVVLVVCDGVTTAPDSDLAALAAAAPRAPNCSPPRRRRTADDAGGRCDRPLVAGDRRATAAGQRRGGRRAHALGDPPEPPSCTFVAAVVAGDVLTVGWCGDSRAYWLPDDGSGAAAHRRPLARHGADRRTARPRRRPRPTRPSHTITRWLGADRSTPARRSARCTSTAPGWLLVCSDGLWNYASEAEALAELIATAVAAGPADPVAIAGPSSSGPTPRAATTTSPRPWPASTRRYADPARPSRGVRPVAEFTAEVFQNEYLADGATDVHAVVSVTCSDAGTAGQTGLGEAAEILIVDTSRLDGHAVDQDRRGPTRRQGGARRDRRRHLVRRRQRAQRRPDGLPDPPGHGPDGPRPRRRDAVDAGRAGLRSGGATAIGAWIAAADELFAPGSRRPAPRHPADRRQERGRAARGAGDALLKARGKFQCDCRGVGTDWVVDELRRIADALLGTVDIIAEPDDLEADFEAMIRASMGRGVRRRPAAGVGAAGQRGPVRPPGRPDGRGPHATGRPDQPADPRVPDRRVGRREPRLPRRRPRAAGAGRAASGWPPGSRWWSTTRCWPRAWCKAMWSDDTNLTTRIDPAVAHYTGQAELADAIQQGLAAKAAGDERTATTLLGEAAKLAHDTGNESTTRLLRQGGRRRRRRDRHGAAQAATSTRSTRWRSTPARTKTTRIRREGEAPA